MKWNSKLAIVLILFWLMITPTVAGQNDEMLQWKISVAANPQFCGEQIKVNVTGTGNTSFGVRFLHFTDSNKTFMEYGRTNETGVAILFLENWEDGQQGFYHIQLLVNEIVVDSISLEVVFDEVKALKIEIQKLEERIQLLWAWKDYFNEDDREDERRYRKWIAFVILGLFPLVCFDVLYRVYRDWDLLKERRQKWWIEIRSSRPMQGLFGSLSVDDRNTFYGLDDDKPVFQEGMKGVKKEEIGLTKEQAWAVRDGKSEFSFENEEIEKDGVDE